MDIVGFFGKNIGLLIFLVAVMAPLLGRKIGQGSKGNPQRPLRPMPTFGGGPGERKTAAPVPSRKWDDELMEQERQELEARLREEEREAAMERERQLERRHSGDGEQPGRRPAASASAKRSSAAPSGLPVRASAPDAGAIEASDSDWTANREAMAKAVIWAEVLGPPRAKRPYRR